MNQTLTAAKITMLEYKMAILMFVLFSVNSLCSCFVASMAGSVWATLDTQSKITVVVAMVGNWTGTVIAFVSKAATRIKQTGDIFTATTTDMHQESVTSQPAPQPPKP